LKEKKNSVRGGKRRNGHTWGQKEDLPHGEGEESNKTVGKGEQGIRRTEREPGKNGCPGGNLKEESKPH